MKINIVREALQRLTPRERQIVLLRYGLDDRKKTLDQMAEMFGCSRTAVYVQEQKTLVKMKHTIQEIQKN